ncbi:TPA: hypothetical protein ACP5S6_004623, partial [Vibrio parahaemolyticus]
VNREALMKISKSNPHQIVKNQHIFPSQSLARFYDGSRTIGVAYKDGSKAFRTKANNSVFCVNRAWNEHAESVSMKAIEDTYQSVVEKILKGLDLNADEHLAITKMYALWKYRSELLTRVEHNIVIQNSEGITEQGEAERLEKAGIYFPFKGEFSSQMMAGLEVHYAIKETCQNLGEDMRWGVLSAIGGEFVIPDLCPDLVVIPMTPEQLLTAKKANNYAGLDVVNELNEYFIKSSKSRYYYR